MNLTIARIGNDETTKFAVSELCRYLKLVDENIIITELAASCCSKEDNKLFVGVSEEFDEFLPAVSDKNVDDGIYIDVKNGKGVISGTNKRSVLIAVYRFLKELGFAWVRPGQDGEIFPERVPENFSVKVCESASYRHRNVCIEGAVSYEHVKNAIDWIPKAAMNGYYIQFRVPHTFFDRWYSHIDNDTFEKTPASYNDIKEMQKRIEEEIAKRDLMYHAVGHGWTCEPFGVHALGWDKQDVAAPEKIKSKLALINGKREFWKGIAINTNLCYSDPEVRNVISDEVVKYCSENPNVSYVHVWLADGMNNQCECEECAKKRPSDYYVMLLNEIDEKLTRSGQKTKIVFLMYVDLLWASETEKIKNKDRFLLMFAPITRTYTSSFANAVKADKEMRPYIRNKLVMPQSIEENLAYLKSWKNIFDGDSVDFDYHLMWDHYKDVGYYECSHILFEDAKALEKIGLNGLISCQVQRAAFPTGLPMEMMSRALWNKNADFETEASDYFKTAFGKDGEKARIYLKTLSEMFVPQYIRGELGRENKEVAEKVRKAKTFISEFSDTVLKNIEVTSGNVKKSWEYLKIHSEFCLMYADVIAFAAEQNKKLAEEALSKLLKFAKTAEHDIHNVFDVWTFTYTMHNILNALFD